MAQYLPLVVRMVLAGGFAGISFVTARVLNPPKPTAAKVSPYECGIVDQVPPPERFPVRFYLVAMIFIVFDIEIIFFYPWAIAHKEVGWFGLVAVLIFSFAVFESFVYLIANGALEWGPVKRLRDVSATMRLTDMRSAERTSTSTIRRVGLEGREEGGEAA